MENLSFLALLACPLMMIGMLFLMKRMGDQNTRGKTKYTDDMHQKLSELVEQNEELSKEIESIKRSR